MTTAQHLVPVACRRHHVSLPYDRSDVTRGTPAAAVQARDFVSDHAAGLGDRLLADAHLLVTELVSNALRYGAPEICVSVSRRPDAFEVAVKDSGPALPTLPQQLPDSRVTRGRGLLIVDTLARTWGVRHEPAAEGKTVWFALA